MLQVQKLLDLLKSFFIFYSSIFSCNLDNKIYQAVPVDTRSAQRMTDYNLFRIRSEGKHKCQKMTIRKQVRSLK